MAAEHDDIFHHVRDYPYFELPFGVNLWLPEIPFLPSPSRIMLALQGEIPAGEIWGLQLTRFMVLQVVAGLFVLWVYRGLARRLSTGEPAQGRWWNFWETLALYIRDNVVRPTIGDVHHHHEDADHARHPDFVGGGENIHVAHEEPHLEDVPTGGHPADRYLPFVWTCFFYILISNLIGAIPWMGTATAEINVTAALALTALGAVVLAGSRQSGVAGFWLNLAPSMDMPAVMKVAVVPMIWVIELVGLLIKHGVLAVRLFANIMAGHTVVAVILGFIAAAEGGLFYVVLPSSILGQIAIGLLELLVAFLQAYIFSFLATLFISTAVHPH